MVVLTAKELAPEERELLSGSVAKVVQKGAYSREELLREVRRVVGSCAGGPHAV